jgi:nucleotide-binding universal stress UspA family protein
MNSSSRDKILVACDGSQHSLQIIDYVSSVLDARRFEIVLFHVFIKVPESFIDIEQKLPAYHYRIINVDAWEKKQETSIQDFMENAKRILLDAGFPDEAVTIRINERKVGVARDIAAEAASGYKALVVGRRGLSDFKDFMLGSVATNIIGLVSIPIWLAVAGKPKQSRILMCLDNSEGAMTALKHLAFVLDTSKKSEITLFHAVREFHRFKKFVREMFASEGDKAAIEDIERELQNASKLLEPSFDKAKATLISSGVDPAGIHQKILSGANHAAQAIIEEAEKGKYDTIVVGRRGLSKVEEFIMGRVSNRVIHMVKDKTVWVVN